MKKYCNAGGQALIEGIMMRGGNSVSTVIRRKDGTLVEKSEKIEKKPLLNKVFLIRGIFVFVSAMTIGIKALNYSAKFFEEDYELEQEDKLEAFLKKVFKDKYQDVAIFISLVLAIGLAVILFIATPSFLVSFLRNVIDNKFILAFLEGVTKMSMFIAYILLISKMEEVKRVFQYHGAEHKAIHCIEHGDELTVENARKYTTLHPRCGTSFLLFVLIISTIVFSFVSWNNVPLRIGMKILFLPLVAGISYEILKLTGTKENWFLKMLSMPGLWMQKITTKEPDDGQLEVAIVALKKVMESEKGC